MCTICATFRPHEEKCPYTGEILGGPVAPAPDPDTAVDPAPIAMGSNVNEGADAAAGTNTNYEISVGDTFVGELDFRGDRDWIEIDLTAGTRYFFSLNGSGSPALNDPVLRLRDADGTVIALNDDGGSGNNAAIGFVAESTGTYYLDAGGFADFREGNYRLSTGVDNSNIPIATNQELADYLETGYWQDSGGFAHQFDTRNSNVITVDIGDLNADGQRLARWALQSFEMVADVKFDVVNSNNADITFDDEFGGAYAQYSANGQGFTNSVFINVSKTWIDGGDDDINDYGLQTYIHEIGHALGLGHQGNYNGSATYGVANNFANDSWLNSIMSYFDMDENPYVQSTFANVITPMVADVIALQNMYGAPSASNSPTAGNTVYGVGHTFGNMFQGTDLNNNGSYMAALFNYLATGADPNNWFDTTPVAITIVDAGGNDHINFSSDTNDQYISLVGETLSTVYNELGEGQNGNMWIAAGTVIEDYTAGSGDDVIEGNSVGNEIKGNDGNDFVAGGAGNDYIFGDAGSDTVYGGNDADTVFGGGGADMLYGDQGNDLLIGGNGADTMDGGNGNDVMQVGNGDVVTDTGTSGYDRALIQFTTGQFLDLDDWSGVERIDGNVGNDTIDASGYSSNLLVLGFDGNDSIIGGSGNDTLLGGAGADIIITGNGNNIADGGAGGDTVTGGNGNDTIYVDNGADSITDAGGGFDSAFINNASGVSLDAGGWVGVERILGFNGDDTIDATGMANAIIINGGAGRDSLIGSGNNDTLIGGSDNDILIGGGGNDAMLGQTGNDTYIGGAGNDQMFIGENGDAVSDGGTGFDTAVINNAAGVSLNIGSWVSVERINGFTGDDIINASGLTTGIVFAASSGNDEFTGGSGNDTVYAGDGADILRGGVGDDVLIAGGNNDTIAGGTGDDFMNGNAGADVFEFAANFGNDTIGDFDGNGDILDFSAINGVNDISDLTITSNGVSTFVSITGGGSDQLALANFTDTLTNADFNFV